jgi:hypothetical protein
MLILFSHIENRSWKKFAKGPVTTTNFLKILVNDEETTLSKLNHIYGKEKHVFFGIRMPNRRLHVSASTTEV